MVGAAPASSARSKVPVASTRSSFERMVFLDELLRLQTNGALPTDTVIICCGGKEVHAHALTLGAMSPVLLAALQPDRFKEGQTRELDLSWADADHVEFAITFAFAKDADHITGENAMALLHLANRLDFEELRAACETTLCSLLTSDNAGEILQCAEQCNCVALADEARTVRDDPDISQTVSALMAQRHEVTRKIERNKKQRQENEREKQTFQRELNNLTERINFEAEKAFKEASSKREAEAADDAVEAAPSYPHAVGRTLVVMPSSSKRRKKDQKSNAEAALQFATLGDAIGAARRGDLISLPPGDHYFYDTAVKEAWQISKSLQIVGSGPETVLRDEGDTWESMMQVSGGADVRLANLSIDGTKIACEGVVVVKEESCVWLDACELKIHEGGIYVRRNSSAVLTGCTIKGGMNSAIQIDPQANRAVIVGCSISGCSTGSEHSDNYSPHWLPGDCGAIEVSAHGWGKEQRSVEEDNGFRFSRPVDEQARVKLEVRRTSIVSCFGHALSYRTEYRYQRRSAEFIYCEKIRHFTWPGQAEFILCDNILTSNCLAILGEPDAAGANADELILNCRPIGDDRPDFEE